MRKQIRKLYRRISCGFLKRPLRNKSGVSLVELIATIILVALLSIPLAMFTVQNISSTVQAHDYSMAVNLARFEMELVSNMDYDSISSGTFTNYQNYNYDVVRTVNFVLGGAASAEGIKRIIVDVRPAGSTTVISSFTTYRGRNVTYGL